jgi:hypothetical protein
MWKTINDHAWNKPGYNREYFTLLPKEMDSLCQDKAGTGICYHQPSPPSTVSLCVADWMQRQAASVGDDRSQTQNVKINEKTAALRGDNVVKPQYNYHLFSIEQKFTDAYKAVKAEEALGLLRRYILIIVDNQRRATPTLHTRIKAKSITSQPATTFRART